MTITMDPRHVRRWDGMLTALPEDREGRASHVAVLAEHCDEERVGELVEYIALPEARAPEAAVEVLVATGRTEAINALEPCLGSECGDEVVYAATTAILGLDPSGGVARLARLAAQTAPVDAGGRDRTAWVHSQWFRSITGALVSARPSPPIAELKKLLKHSHWIARQLAYRVLPSIGNPLTRVERATKSAETLEMLLEHEHACVRQAARVGLEHAKASIRDERPIDKMLPLLGHDNPKIVTNAIRLLCESNAPRAKQALLMQLVPATLWEPALMRLCDNRMYEQLSQVHQETGDNTVLEPIRFKTMVSPLSTVRRRKELSEDLYNHVIESLLGVGDKAGGALLAIVKDRPADADWMTVRALGCLAGRRAASYLRAVTDCRRDLHVHCALAFAEAGCREDTEALFEVLRELRMTPCALRFIVPVARAASQDARRLCIRVLWTWDFKGPTYSVAAAANMPTPVAVRALIPLVWPHQHTGTSAPAEALDALCEHLRSPGIGDVCKEDLEDVASRDEACWFTHHYTYVPHDFEPYVTSDRHDLDCSEARSLAQEELRRRASSGGTT